jgi:hypothetical protein
MRPTNRPSPCHPVGTFRAPPPGSPAIKRAYTASTASEIPISTHMTAPGVSPRDALSSSAHIRLICLSISDSTYLPLTPCR